MAAIVVFAGSGTSTSQRTTTPASGPTIRSTVPCPRVACVTLSPTLFHGGVQNYGTPWYGSDIGHLPAGVTATGITADPVTGGYWIVKSNGGVDVFAAPWYGSLAWHVPAGQSVTGIAGE